MTTGTGYCAACDGEDSVETGDECSRCGASLYDSYDAYVDEMVEWLGEREGMSEEAVVDLLNGHGNPTKGQALVILDKREVDDVLSDGGTAHYHDAGDGQCVAINDSDGRRCTNGVYGSNVVCGTHKNASDVTLAPDHDDREWRLCPHCGWQPASWDAEVAVCSHCEAEFPLGAERWSERGVVTDGGEYPPGMRGDPGYPPGMGGGPPDAPRSDGGDSEAVTERERYTHLKWECTECGSEVWLPRGALGHQTDHANRPFCGCNEQGIRMTPTHEGVEL